MLVAAGAHSCGSVATADPAENERMLLMDYDDSRDSARDDMLAERDFERRHEMTADPQDHVGCDDDECDCHEAD